MDKIYLLTESEMQAIMDRLCALMKSTKETGTITSVTKVLDALMKVESIKATDQVNGVLGTIINLMKGENK